MIVIKEEGSHPIKMWVGTRPSNGVIQTGFQAPDIEDGALQQLKNVAKLPFLHKNGVAVMPDVHWGIGATIGSVIATHRAIIPAAVGVDIGCGMNAVRTSLKLSDLPESLALLRNDIERSVPTGAHQKEEIRAANLARLPAGDKRWGLPLILGAANDPGGKRAASQLGTLGSGNHFIEVCGDENQDVWVMLHSGSRGTGNILGRQYIDIAKGIAERYFINLPDKDLAYLPHDTAEFNDYIMAVSWCQDYALENRRVMMEAVLRSMQHRLRPFDVTHEAINCHHNYVEKENHFGENVWVTRKGAIRARSGDLGIIPGSMGQRSFIVRGLGNPESYCSCSHGAGRRLGRKAAMKAYTVADLVAQTVGVECRKDDGVLDEIPAAYKDIDNVMAQQRDLVEVIHTLKQVLCVKGS